ncbi:hypothetical protein SEA_ATUIN_282 [Arthrobacter phage Atuin]|nr:hypothetical protein SEA_ATUIN_81 [Arthrobacter phage Atuin]
MTLRQQEEASKVDHLAKAKECLKSYGTNYGMAKYIEVGTLHATIAVAEELRAIREPKRDWGNRPTAYALVRTLNGVREVHSIYLNQNEAMTEAVSLNDMGKKQMESTDNSFEVKWSVEPHTLEVGKHG